MVNVVYKCFNIKGKTTGDIKILVRNRIQKYMTIIHQYRE